MPGKRGRDKKPAAAADDAHNAPSTRNPREFNPSNNTARRSNQNEIRTGNAITFLLQTAPQLTDLDLIGTIPAPESPLHQQLQTISRFLTQHRATMALNNTPYYQPTMDNFSATQLDRQSAGLRTNTNANTAQGSNQVMERHRSVLESAMQNAAAATTDASFQLFSTEQLRTWHGILCPDLAQAGQYRTTQVRAGNTRFGPPNGIETEMTALFAALSALQMRWASRLAATATLEGALSATYHGIALAAIMLHSICSIHPFADGNGRMARISLNWMLRRVLGLPFTNTLTATHQQRREYIAALQHGHVRSQQLSSATGSSATATTVALEPAAFAPLISLLIGRIAHAVQEVQRLLTERANAATAEEEARIARRVRERTAEGQCIICLEDRPNIATLCCGQAVHLNCLAEWLSTRNTCVMCRNALPRMNRPAAAPAAVVLDPVVLPQDTTTSEDEPYDVAGAESSTYEDTTVDETTVDDTTVVAPAQNVLPTCVLCNQNQAALDCDNQMCARCCTPHGTASCVRHYTTASVHRQPLNDDTTADSTTEDYTTIAVAPAVAPANNDTTIESTTEDDTTSVAAPAVPPPNNDSTTDSTTEEDETTTARQAVIYCTNCTNRSASDCSNNMCGRCCILNGQFNCDRHRC
jgi:fido (protein-threonine AMPylation protein)